MHLYLSFPISQPQFLHLLWKPSFPPFLSHKNYHTLKPTVQGGLAKVPVGQLWDPPLRNRTQGFLALVFVLTGGSHGEFGAVEIAV